MWFRLPSWKSPNPARGWYGKHRFRQRYEWIEDKSPNTRGLSFLPADFDVAGGFAGWSPICSLQLSGKHWLLAADIRHAAEASSEPACLHNWISKRAIGWVYSQQQFPDGKDSVRMTILPSFPSRACRPAHPSAGPFPLVRKSEALPNDILSPNWSALTKRGDALAMGSCARCGST